MGIKSKSFELVSDQEVNGHYLVEEVIHYDDGTTTASWHWTANEHIYMDLLPKEEDNGKPN